MTRGLFRDMIERYPISIAYIGGALITQFSLWPAIIVGSIIFAIAGHEYDRMVKRREIAAVNRAIEDVP